MNIPPSGIVLPSGATPLVSTPPSPLASAANRVGAIAPVVGGTALTIASYSIRGPHYWPSNYD